MKRIVSQEEKPPVYGVLQPVLKASEVEKALQLDQGVDDFVFNLN